MAMNGPGVAVGLETESSVKTKCLGKITSMSVLLEPERDILSHRGRALER